MYIFKKEEKNNPVTLEQSFSFKQRYWGCEILIKCDDIIHSGSCNKKSDLELFPAWSHVPFSPFPPLLQLQIDIYVAFANIVHNKHNNIYYIEHLLWVTLFKCNTDSTSFNRHNRPSFLALLVPPFAKGNKAWKLSLHCW